MNIKNKLLFSTVAVAALAIVPFNQAMASAVTSMQEFNQTIISNNVVSVESDISFEGASGVTTEVSSPGIESNNKTLSDISGSNYLLKVLQDQTFYIRNLNISNSQKFIINYGLIKI